MTESRPQNRIFRRFACGFLVAALLASSPNRLLAELTLQTKQITHGAQHHFFGYIGQSLTTPWNASGRYILAMRVDFHDHMPTRRDAADIILIDTENNNQVTPIEKTRAWNFQQGTMFYWHPKHAETQFFFNDRDPETNSVFTVLYDIKEKRRVREYRFEDVPVANGGVAPTGDFFLAINYGRMARLRPVTGYPEISDVTSKENAPENDGVFRVDIETGKRTLLVSFAQLRDLIEPENPKAAEAGFYINHSLSSRDGRFAYFYARGRDDNKSMAVNVPCSIRTDGTGLRTNTFIGGHPEWDLGSVVIGSKDGRQVRYDVQSGEIIGQIGNKGDFPNPEGDVSVSPNGEWFANGWGTNKRTTNEYIIMRRADKAMVRSQPFSRGDYTRGELRIDPAPRWNRGNNTILVPGVVDGVRHLFTLTVGETER